MIKFFFFLLLLFCRSTLNVLIKILENHRLKSLLWTFSFPTFSREENHEKILNFNSKQMSQQLNKLKNDSFIQFLRNIGQTETQTVKRHFFDIILSKHFYRLMKNERTVPIHVHLKETNRPSLQQVNRSIDE